MPNAPTAPQSAAKPPSPATALPNARLGNDAGWDQLRRDLDALQAIGINLLRIIGATEGSVRGTNVELVVPPAAEHSACAQCPRCAVQCR